MLMPSALEKYRNVAIILTVTVFVGLVVLVQSAGSYIVASEYAARFNFLPKDHLPLADSDCYKWANLLRQPLTDWTDPAEVKEVSGPIGVRWAAPTRIYLKALNAAFSIFTTPSRAESWALFFSMPILTVLATALISAFCLFRLRSPLAALLLPPALLLMPSVASQMPPGRPDHHGLIILAVALFLLSLFQPAKLKSTATFSAAVTAFALWMSPLNFIPVMSVFCAAALAGMLIRKLPSAPSPTIPICFASESPQFWKTWAIQTFSLSLFFWLLDYSYRPGQLHMENLNPVWSLGILGGGIFMFQIATATSIRSATRALSWLSLVLPALILLLLPEFFWTRSEEISWVLKEVNEMRPGDLGTLFSIAPMIFVALLILASLLPRHTLTLPFLAAIVVSAFYLWQIRWLPPALMAPTIVLGSVFAVRPKGWVVRTAALALAVQVIWYTSSVTRTGFENIRNPKGAPEMYNVAMFSAMAARMAREQGETKVLASPNMTSTMFYTSGTRGIGSVYWESRPNLRFASKIFGSTPSTDEQAKALLKEHGIKMLAITPQVLDTAYIGLSGNWSRMDETLVVRLIKGQVPPWLEVVARVNQPWPGLGLYKVVD
jgi:hypothetical protein